MTVRPRYTVAMKARDTASLARATVGALRPVVKTVIFAWMAHRHLTLTRHYIDPEDTEKENDR